MLTLLVARKNLVHVENIVTRDFVFLLRFQWRYVKNNEINALIYDDKVQSPLCYDGKKQKEAATPATNDKLHIACIYYEMHYIKIYINHKAFYLLCSLPFICDFFVDYI